MTDNDQQATNNSSSNSIGDEINKELSSNTESHQIPTMATPDSNESTPQSTASQPITKRFSKKTALIICLLLALIGGGAYAYKTLVYDQQPEVFVKSSLMNTINHEKRPIITVNVKPNNKQLSALINSIEFSGKPSSNNQIFSGQLTLDSPVIGKNSIDVILDANKKSAFVKPNLSSTVTLFLPGILNSQMNLSTRDMTEAQKKLANSFITNAIAKIISTINNQWIQLPEEDAQELFNQSKTTPDFVKIQKDCSTNTSRDKLTDVISVKSELDKIESSRVFEVEIDQDKLKDFAQNDTCGRLIFDKNNLERQLKYFQQLPSIKLQISNKKYIEAIIMSNNDLDITVKTDFATNNTEDVEIPKDAVSIKELQEKIESIFLSSNSR